MANGLKAIVCACGLLAQATGLGLRASRTESDPLGILSAFIGNATARESWLPAHTQAGFDPSKHPIELAKATKMPPITAKDRLDEKKGVISMAKLKRSQMSRETVLRNMVLDAPIVKTKLNWECKKARTSGLRKTCEWQKATAHFCHLLPQSISKMVGVGKLESETFSLLSKVDMHDEGKPHVLVALQEKAEFGPAGDMFADINKNLPESFTEAGNRLLEPMYKRVVKSREFQAKVAETCASLSSRQPNCETTASNAVFCSVLTQAALRLVQVEDLAAMMAGKMEMHFDEISLY